MPVLPGDIADVVATYLAATDPQEYRDAARNRQFSVFGDLFVSNPIVKKKTKRYETYRVEFMNRRYNNTRNKSIDSADSLNRGSLATYGTLNMAFQDTHMVVNKLESAFTGGTEQEIVNYLDMHLVNMYDGFFEFNDDKLFQLPTYPNTVDPLFWSIPYYITPYTTGDVGFGFNGGNPGSYTAVAGIDRSSAANSGLKNGTGEFTTVDAMDFCRIGAEAYQKCNFKPYHTVKKERATEVVPEHRFHFFSDFTLWQEYQDIAYTSNDNIGIDQGKYRGGANAKANIFMNENWTWVPDRLESGAETAVIGTRYFYGLDLSTWELHHYGDWFMKFEKNAIRLEDSHNTLVSWMEAPFQLFCNNPRNNFVIVPAA
jgi:hypothetical protein